MPRGGKRPGAGRKATRPPAKRRLMLELDASEAEMLAALEERWPGTAAEVLRHALVMMHADVIG